MLSVSSFLRDIKLDITDLAFATIVRKEMLFSQAYIAGRILLSLAGTQLKDIHFHLVHLKYLQWCNKIN